jgi:hypothetical protein
MLFRGRPLGGAETRRAHGLAQKGSSENRVSPCEAESSRRRAQPVFLSRCLREHAGQEGIDTALSAHIKL